MGRLARIGAVLFTLVAATVLALLVSSGVRAAADHAAAGPASTSPTVVAGLAAAALPSVAPAAPVTGSDQPQLDASPTTRSAETSTKVPTATSSTAAASTTAAPTTRAPTATAPAAADPVDQEAVADAVTAAVAQAAQQGITEHVVVLDRTTGATITDIGADLQVPSMSLVKLFIATDAIAQAGGVDQLSADDRERLTTMIEQSDDEIAQDFYDADGGSDIIERTAARYGLSGTAPSPEPEYWGDVQVTATDLASFLQQALTSPETGPFLSAAMQASTPTGSDGFDQEFGVHALSGTGSKQGWGCCLGGVLAIHSVGFTADRIVVVLSTSPPDDSPADLDDADQLAADPGAQAATAAVTATARAAFSGDEVDRR